MPDTNEAPAAIRSALAYFQRGGLVEMTERTLAEIAAGRAVVECDADGVLALCSLAAAAMVARAGRGEGDDALVEAMLDLWYPARRGFGDWRENSARHIKLQKTEMGELAAVVRAHDAPTLATLTASLAEAEARAGRLRGLLWFAYHEFNAIRARSGAPLTQDGMTTCAYEWWSQMTEAFAEAIGPDARTPWPSPEAKAALAALQETPHGR
jgi:hypothetical protein